MNPPCEHSCKGLCHALDIAEQREAEAIEDYRQYAGVCDYPEVRSILESLIAERQKTLRVLREQREILNAKFNTLDRINDSFA